MIAALASLDRANKRLEMRRAVEAQRSGVPSAAAVRSLGSGQEALTERFRGMLETSDEVFASGNQCPGLLVRAGFGEGKSHLLTAFEHIALDSGYAVSRVVISKETPLYVPTRLLANAVENLRVPHRIGRGLDEVGLLLRKRFDSIEFGYLQGCLSQGRLNARFAVTLQMFRDGIHDEEVVDRVLRFWSGEPFEVGQIKRIMRDLGIGDLRLEKINARQLAVETFTFIPQMLRAAGLRGWVLLIDELELVGRYGRVGRSQAYAELSRWMGALEADPRPGLVTVGAVTSDFEREVLLDKGDLHDMAPPLQLFVSDLFADSAAPSMSETERGMQLIRQAELLAAPDQALLESTYTTLKRLHGVAYSWEPPDVAWPEVLGATPMRTYVRAWINAWDVRRLYNVRADEDGFEIDVIGGDYREVLDLEEREAGADA